MIPITAIVASFEYRPRYCKKEITVCERIFPIYSFLSGNDILTSKIKYNQKIINIKYFITIYTHRYLV